MVTPPNARKVFSGKIFDVYHWEQELFDGSHETFERLKRPDSAHVIACSEGKVWICEQEQPGRGAFISTFGGRVDPGETPEEAAKRELLEEGGLRAVGMQPLFSVRPVSKIDWTVHCYLATGCKKVSEPTLEPGERIVPKKVTPDEFIDIVLQEGFRGSELQKYILDLHYRGELESFKASLTKPT